MRPGAPSSEEKALLDRETQHYSDSAYGNIDDQSRENLSHTLSPASTPDNAAVIIEDEEIEPPLSARKIAVDLFKQAGPNSLRGAVVAGRYLATSLMLAHLDEKLLAPNTLICLLESLEVVLGSRSLNPVATEVGRLKGAGQTNDIGAIVRQGTILAAMVGAPISALYYFANHHFLQLVGQHPFAVDEARKYFQAAAPGYFALMLFTTQQRFFQGIKHAHAALYSSTLHCILIASLSYIFIYGKLGLPELAMQGAGYAFSIATWSALFLHTGYMFAAKWLNEYDLFKTKETFNIKNILHLAHVGIPSGIQIAIENASNITNSIFLGRVALYALTADQVSLQVAQIISIANNGLGGAINPCVSTAIGQNKFHNARKYGHVGMLMGLIFPAVAFSLLLFFNKQFTHLFINTNNTENDEITDLARHFLLLECLRQLVTSMQVTTSFALQGIKDTKFSMVSSIGFSFTANLSLLFLLTDVTKSSLEMIYASKAIGFFITALLNFSRWIMKSHEVSESDKAIIADKSIPQRLCRGASLFLGKQEALEVEQGPEETDALSAHF